MKYISALIFVLMVFNVASFAQEKTDTPLPQEPKLNWYGYVNFESIFDSHESVTSRYSELYFYPDKKTDDSQNDQLDMLSLNSRIGAKVTGLSVFGAKAVAVIEGDFFGTAESYKNLFRMRHAYMKMQWEKSSLLMGQFWHPTFGPEVFPKVLAFGAAAIYNPLNRAPQLRFDYKPTPLINVTGVALMHGYHISVGPAGLTETAQRNSAKPDLQFQLTIGDAKKFVTGINAGYMWLQPRETMANDRINDAELGTYNLGWFGKIAQGPLTVQAKFSYGQNMSQFVMLGGYGRLLEDASSLEFDYTPFKIYSAWLDAAYKIDENIEAGVFAGVTQNLGTEDKVNPDHIYARGKDISQLIRISPRVSYTIEKFKFGVEYAYNLAAYGVGTPDEYNVYDKTEDAINHRLMLVAFYNF